MAGVAKQLGYFHIPFLITKHNAIMPPNHPHTHTHHTFFLHIWTTNKLRWKKQTAKTTRLETPRVGNCCPGQKPHVRWLYLKIEPDIELSALELEELEESWPEAAIEESWPEAAIHSAGHGTVPMFPFIFRGCAGARSRALQQLHRSPTRLKVKTSQ